MAKNWESGGITMSLMPREGELGDNGGADGPLGTWSTLLGA